jgi:hypothetical protein
VSTPGPLGPAGDEHREPIKGDNPGSPTGAGTEGGDSDGLLESDASKIVDGVIMSAIEHMKEESGQVSATTESPGDTPDKEDGGDGYMDILGNGLPKKKVGALLGPLVKQFQLM